MITLLYSGNVGIGQDLHTVLRALKSINGTLALRMLIVGAGKGIPAVRQLAADLCLANVAFRDPAPLDKLAELLAEGDIHLICQKPGTEGLLVPSKIYSTLASGRPSLFIGPTNCEAADIVRDSRSGLVVAPGDIDGTLKALVHLGDSGSVRRKMGKNAKEYYSNYFGRKQSVTKIARLIELVDLNARKMREERFEIANRKKVE